MKILPVHYRKNPQKAQSISKLYMRLKSRITMYFFLLVIIPTFLTAAIMYIHTRTLIEEMAYKAAVSRISLENEYIGKCLDDLKSAIYTSADSADAADANNLPAIINDNFSPIQQKALSAVYIIDENGIKSSFGPDSAQAVISSPSSQKWFQDVAANGSAVIMLGTVQRFYSEGISKIVLSAAKSINSGSGKETQTIMLLDFNYGILSDFLKPSDENSTSGHAAQVPEERIIVDQDGNILYSPETGKLTTKADETILSAVKDTDEDFKKISYKDTDYFMTFRKYDNLNWTFIDLNPVSNVTGRLWLRSPLLTAALLVFILVLLIFVGITLGLLRPINDLTAVISDYENSFTDSKSHIPLLQVKKNSSSSSSTSDVDYLINKISSIKLSQKEAELNSLQNQINPHFLYNTLESIRGAALYHGIHEIAAMSKSLSLLFRYSISEKVLVSVKDEFQHLENYISIQNFRFEDKFELQYNIPPELMNYKILKLTLQPLIENSIKHGLEMKLGKGTIKLEILSLESNIKILISDDGLGIPPKKLEELNRALASEKSMDIGEDVRTGTGIGVMNVNSRIKLYFGEQYGLRFKETLAGTTVEITLPAVKES